MTRRELSLAVAELTEAVKSRGDALAERGLLRSDGDPDDPTTLDLR